jgi:hypothetical protein
MVTHMRFARPAAFAGAAARHSRHDRRRGDVTGAAGTARAYRRDARRRPW